MFRFAAIAALALSAPSLALAAGDSARCLPIETGDGGSPVIRARVNGEGPFAFVLDTAASGTTLDETRIALLKPPRDAATEQAEGLGGPMDVKLYRVTTFDAGPANLRDFTVPGIPAPRFESHDVAGLAGIDVFGDALAVWAPDAPCVTLRTGGETPGDGWRKVEARWIRPWKIMLPIRIDGVDGWGLLDTGAQSTVLNPAFAARLALKDGARRPGGEISGIDGRPLALEEADVGAVAVGLWTWPRRTAKIGVLPVFARLGEADAPLAIIGMDWLKDAAFAIDYRSQVVWQRPDLKP